MKKKHHELGFSMAQAARQLGEQAARSKYAGGIMSDSAVTWVHEMSFQLSLARCSDIEAVLALFSRNTYFCNLPDPLRAELYAIVLDPGLSLLEAKAAVRVRVRLEG